MTRAPRRGISASSPAILHQSRMLGDGRGKFMFIGDAANLSFLKIIRRLVGDSIGSCLFTDDPLRHLMVEATPDCGQELLRGDVAQPAKPDPVQAEQLLRRYMVASNSIFNLFDESELSAGLMEWRESASSGVNDYPRDAVFYLVLAIGAQNSAHEYGEIGKTYFKYGRWLAMSTAMEEPTNLTIQSFLLIAVYLYTASRRNAAYMHLGTAVQAAYALGVQQSDFAAPFTSEEHRLRERLWKAVRSLDMCLSVALGRPPATAGCRNNFEAESYSAVINLSDILESILVQVYAKRMVTSEALDSISERHRQWAARLPEGLLVDNIESGDLIEADDGEKHLNIGLLHLKSAYYWSIMLLSRPFLVDYVSQHNSRPRTLHNGSSSPTSPDQVLIHACVDSAVRTIDLVEPLISNDRGLTRLPFLVDIIFASALIVGLAVFGDLDRTFPLNKRLSTARMLLLKFSAHDPVASRVSQITGYLQESCELYMESKAQLNMQRQGHLISELFGSVSGTEEVRGQTHNPRQPAEWADQNEDQTQDTRAVRAPSETSACGVNRRISQHSIIAEPQALAISVGNKAEQIPAELGGWADMALPISPRTLYFDSYDEDMPFFPIADSQVADIGRMGEIVLDGPPAMLG